MSEEIDLKLGGMNMIIEGTGLKGLVCDLAYLDEVATNSGFIRWQWEYKWATYDLKLESKADNAEYFLRFNARVTEGRLESPYAMLILGDVYIGKATFPHGLDYESAIPDPIMKESRRKLSELRKKLSDTKTVSEMMTKDCITVSINDNLYDVALKMRNHNIGFIPVVEERKLIGVITDRDLVIRGYADHQTESVTVKQVISKEIISILPSASVEEAAKLMANEQIRRLLVVENGQLLGVVALGDLATSSVYENEVGEALGQISIATHA